MTLSELLNKQTDLTIKVNRLSVDVEQNLTVYAGKTGRSYNEFSSNIKHVLLDALKDAKEELAAVNEKIALIEKLIN